MTPWPTPARELAQAALLAAGLQHRAGARGPFDLELGEVVAATLAMGRPDFAWMLLGQRCAAWHATMAQIDRGATMAQLATATGALWNLYHGHVALLPAVASWAHEQRDAEAQAAWERGCS